MGQTLDLLMQGIEGYEFFRWYDRYMHYLVGKCHCKISTCIPQYHGDALSKNIVSLALCLCLCHVQYNYWPSKCSLHVTLLSHKFHYIFVFIDYCNGSSNITKKQCLVIVIGNITKNTATRNRKASFDDRGMYMRLRPIKNKKCKPL